MRDVFMRSSGLDVRESRFPAGRCMAGSVMRVPTILLNEGGPLPMLVGWEFGEYFWDAILDAGVNFGIAPVSAQRRAARGGGRLMLGPAAKAQVLPLARAQVELRRDHHRRRRARPGDGLLPGQAPRDEADRGARPELHRRRRLRPQHHHHPLQLPDAGGHALLRGERQALRDAVPGPRLQHALQPARPPDAGPLRPVAEHDDGARRGEPAAGRRLAGRLPGRDQGAVPKLDVSDHPTFPILAALYHPPGGDHPPRRRRLGLRQGGRPARRRDPPVHRGRRASTSTTAGSPASRRTAARSRPARSSRASPAGAR